MGVKYIEQGSADQRYDMQEDSHDISTVINPTFDLSGRRHRYDAAGQRFKARRAD